MALPKKRTRRSRVRVLKGKPGKLIAGGGSARFGKRKSVMGKGLMRPTIAYHADALPRIMVTKFNYCDAYTLATNAVSTVNSVVTYRLNSPQDPLYAVGGSSCQGWGIAQSYYSNYIVTKALVRVTFTDPSADGLWCGIRFRQASDNDPTGEGIIQLKNTQQTFIRQINNTGSQTQKFKFDIQPWVLNSKDRKSYMYEQDNSAVTTGNPANDNILMDIFTLNFNASAQNLNVIIEIDYVTKLYNRKAI